MVRIEHNGKVQQQQRAFERGRLADRSDEAVAPHRLANELVADPTLEAGQIVDTPAPMPVEDAVVDAATRDVSAPALSRTERHIGRWMAVLVAGLIVLGLGLSAAIFRQWALLGLGALMIVPFMLLLLSPVWLASTTKIAHDNTARQQTGGNKPVTRHVD